MAESPLSIRRSAIACRARGGEIWTSAVEEPWFSVKGIAKPITTQARPNCPGPCAPARIARPAARRTEPEAISGRAP